MDACDDNLNELFKLLQMVPVCDVCGEELEFDGELWCTVWVRDGDDEDYAQWCSGDGFGDLHYPETKTLFKESKASIAKNIAEAKKILESIQEGS